MPTVFSRPPRPGLLIAAAGRQAARGSTPSPATCRPCCAGLPHNVTTEMDLELWRLAERIRADADVGRGVRERRRRDRWPARTGPARCPPSPSTVWRNSSPLRAPGRRRDRPRHAPLGRRPDATSSACSPTTCGSTTRTCAPDRAFARGAAEARGDDRRRWSRAPGSRGRLRGSAGRRSRWAGHGSSPACARARSIYLIAVLAAMRAQLARSARELAAHGRARRRRRRVLPRPAPRSDAGLAGETCATVVAAAAPGVRA